MMDLLPIPIDTLIVFFGASVALGFAPGPDNIFVLTQSMLQGRLAGIFVTLGLATGLIFHTSAVAIGVAAIFATSLVAFNILKAAGAAYLLYLAWGAFRAGSTEVTKRIGEDVNYLKLYRRGIIMNMTNPKVAIFFLAFLPQFADPTQGSMTGQFFFLGAIFILATLVVFGSIAWFSGYLAERLMGSPRAQKMLNRIAGIIFAGLAFKLITASR